MSVSALNEAIISGLVNSDRINNVLSEVMKYLIGITIKYNETCLIVEANLLTLYINQLDELKVAPLLLDVASS